MFFMLSLLLIVGAAAQGWNQRNFGPDMGPQGFNMGRGRFGIPPPVGPPMPFGFMGDIPNPRGPPPFGFMGPRGGFMPPPMAMRRRFMRKHFRFDEAMKLKSRPADWDKRAKRFCRRFPGHPSCQKGGPEFTEFQTIMTTFPRNMGLYLPRVPRMNIRNPFSGVPTDLVDVANKFSVRYGHMDDAANFIRKRCRSFKCMDQSEKTSEFKEHILNKIYSFEKQISGKDTSDAVTLRFDRTQQIKQALLEKVNLTDVVAASDDGVFDRDVLLTEKQQTFLLNELGKAGVGTDNIPEPGSDDDDDDDVTHRLRRASVFFEENIVQKWDIAKPIPYSFDDSLEELDREDVRQALAEITRNTCIKFQYQATAPTTYHLNYFKIDNPTFCGLSYIGRTDPANPIYLSFQCGDSRGVAIHETMHALGVNHQHLRMDRDQHLTIDWSNVNPQHYDYFVVADSKLYTTYGVKYDYGSIMHYNAYTAAVNVTKPTMIPKVNPEKNTSLLGQRAGMSKTDIEILNKMYCKPASCVDKNVYCGAWALKDLCNNPNNKGWMVNNCQKSCNLC